MDINLINQNLNKLLLTLICLLASLSQAQTVDLNGIPLSSGRSDLVQGYTYVLASELAQVMGAQIIIEAGISFILQGQVLEYDIVYDSSSAIQATGSLRVNGSIKASTAALSVTEGIYVPLRSFVETLAGSIAYLADNNSIVAITPKANITNLNLTRYPTYDRISLDLSQPVAYQQSYNAISNSLIIDFPYAQLNETWVANAGLINNAILRPSITPTLELNLAEATAYDLFTIPKDLGYTLVIDVFAQENSQTKANLKLLHDNSSEAFVEALSQDLKSLFEVTKQSIHTPIAPSKTSLTLLIRAIPSEPSFRIYYPEEPNPLFQANPTENLNQSQLESMISVFARQLSLYSGLNTRVLSAAPLNYVNLTDIYFIVEVNPNFLQDNLFVSAFSRSVSELMSRQ